MRAYRVAIFLLLAAAIVAVSGCIEFGAVTEKPPAPTELPTVTPISTPKAQVPDTQVTITLKNVSANQTSEMGLTENLILSIENTGITNVTNLRIAYAVEDPVAAEILGTGFVPVSSLDAGGRTDVAVSLPRYDYLRTITFSAAVYWGDDPEHVNNKTKPWAISLVTHQFWEKS